MSFVEKASSLFAGVGIAWIYNGVMIHSGILATAGVIIFVVGFTYGPFGRRR